MSNYPDFQQRYQSFLTSKLVAAPTAGFAIRPEELHPSTLPHQADTIIWAAAGGRRALFLSFGLGKTHVQLELARLCVAKEKVRALIVCPLGVRGEFKQEADRLGIAIEYVRNQAEVEASDCQILLTNYERVRDGDINPDSFGFVSLDEASCLRSYGSKTYQLFLDIFQNVKFRYVATATPSPNRYKEIIHYAGYLGIMDTGQALTRFFKRDSSKANNLTIHPHKEREFWLWVSSWALFMTSPADLGHDATGYDLPDLQVHWHMVTMPAEEPTVEEDGQMSIVRKDAIDLKTSATEKRESINERVLQAVSLVNSGGPDKSWVIWHDLEAERRALEGMADWNDWMGPTGFQSCYGSQDDETKERLLTWFAQGKYRILATKPSIAGQGCNFQKHCSNAIFLGINYKFNDIIQAVHRIQRFQQPNVCHVHFIYTDAEEHVRREFEAKWARHNELVETMTGIIKEYGLAQAGLIGELTRSMGVKRVEEKGDLFTAVNNDTVLETALMPENSQGMILTSIPFSNHYEYTPSYNDFGHTESDDHFFGQMDFLTPNLHRVLMPGRLCVVHVKDRILFGNVTGTGFPTVNPFHMKTTFHFMKHGFEFCGMITVETDVVRENNQTYRLGWTEQCKDGSKMGVGCPEYLLIFRKKPTSNAKSYSDVPVVKPKEDSVTCPQCEEYQPLSGFAHDQHGYTCPECGAIMDEEELLSTLEIGYTRGKWQIDARNKWNSSGDTLLTPAEIASWEIDKISKAFTERSRDMVYDYQRHVDLANRMDALGKLPAKFEALRIPARSQWVWDDVVRMRTLNSRQAQQREEQHICPFQLDIVDRAITRWSNEGESIYDPFGGLGTVGNRAIALGRRSYSTELNPDYFRCNVGYHREAEYKRKVPTLFDLVEVA